MEVDEHIKREVVRALKPRILRTPKGIAHLTRATASEVHRLTIYDSDFGVLEDVNSNTWVYLHDEFDDVQDAKDSFWRECW